MSGIDYMRHTIEFRPMRNISKQAGAGPVYAVIFLSFHVLRGHVFCCSSDTVDDMADCFNCYICYTAFAAFTLQPFIKVEIYSWQLWFPDTVVATLTSLSYGIIYLYVGTFCHRFLTRP